MRHGTGRSVAAGLVRLALLAPPPRAPAAPHDDPAGDAGAAGASGSRAPSTDREAKAALKAFDTAMQLTERDRRMTALHDLGRFAHPLVAERLLRVAVGDDDVEFRTAAFRALAEQPDPSGRVARSVTAWIAATHGAARRALAKGDFGLVIDRRTGEPDLESEAGKAAVAAKRARARLVAAAIDLAGAADVRAEALREAVLFYLQDGDDDLVALCLRIAGQWKDGEALPAILDLFRMYPAPHRWETGAVADLGGTNAAEAVSEWPLGSARCAGPAPRCASSSTRSVELTPRRALIRPRSLGLGPTHPSAHDLSAKAKWMSVYGDPDKRRPRPAVVAALRHALEAITGRAFAGPDELAAYLKDPPRKGSLR